MMTARHAIALSFAALVSGLSLWPASAHAANSRTVEQYTCKDVMREHGDNRDVTIAFLHGYVLGKSGGSAFDVDALHKQTRDFIERCLDNPNERALDAMAKVKS